MFKWFRLELSAYELYCAVPTGNKRCEIDATNLNAVFRNIHSLIIPDTVQ